MKVEPIKPYIGARVHVDKSSLCDSAVVARCLALLDERGVLVFPRVGLSDEEQLAFTDCLGVPGEGTRNFPAAEAVDEKIFEISLNADNKGESSYVQSSFFWHIDGLVSDAPLPKAALLSARRVAKKGGQTEFANTIVAYEHLPEAEKAEIAQLRAVHSAFAGLRWVVEAPTAEDHARMNAAFAILEHPIVWTQSSGRKSLLIGSTADHVVGMPIAAGRALLNGLLEWTVQPDFKYRHEWEKGDLVLWNNHGTMHHVIPYDANSDRILRRTSFQIARPHRM